MRKETRINLPGIDITVSAHPKTVERLRRNAAYRNIVKPGLNILSGNTANGTNGHSPNGAFEFKPGGRAAGVTVPESGPGRELAEKVNAIDWYHTLEFPFGITTPGFVDHRQQIKYYGLPDDMSGMRALDIATFDGYWAFEMERRGAEVIAVDIGHWFDADIPARWRQWMGPEMNIATGAGFRLAKEVLNSKVDRREVSVYDVAPEDLGKFDVVIISDLLQHLRDPQRALEQTYRVVNDDGCIIVAEVFNDELERYSDVPLSQFTAFVGFAWWMANTAAMKLMLNVAGFHPVEEVSRFPLEHVKKIPANKIVLKGYPWQAKRGEPSSP